MFGTSTHHIHLQSHTIHSLTTQLLTSLVVTVLVVTTLLVVVHPLGDSLLTKLATSLVSVSCCPFSLILRFLHHNLLFNGFCGLLTNRYLI